MFIFLIEIINDPFALLQIGETPFFVALDHENKRVVVAIRGTLSLQVSY